MEKDMQTLLHLEEGVDIELKQCGEKIPLSFYESYSAMANGSGGYIYLGIVEAKPENVISGVNNAKQKKTQLANALTNKSKISPNAFESSNINIIETPLGDVIEVYVPPVPIDQRPVYLNGDPSEAFKRVDQGDKHLEDTEIQGMINDTQKVKFDQKPNEYGFDLKDMDQDAIADFVEGVKREKKIPMVESMEPLDVLARVGAVTFDKKRDVPVMTNGACLFFGKSYVINAIYPSLWMDYQEKSSEETRFSNRITIKDLAFETNIYNFFRRVYRRLSEILPSPFFLENGVNVGGRIVNEIAREALAIAISNVELCSPLGIVIVHSPLSLSIKNAGAMLVGEKQARIGGVSIPRNPCIFNFFLALGVSDYGGYGVPTIFDHMKQLNMPEPSLKESWNRDSTSLLLTFIVVSKSLSKEEQSALAFASLHPEGIKSSMLAEHFSCSNEKARQILLRLYSLGKLTDNGKSTKGRLFFVSLNQNE